MALSSSKVIINGVISYIRDVLKGDLSEMPSAVGSMPSVILARGKQPRPNFPYVVVEKSNFNNEGGNWLLNLDTDLEGNTYYTSEQRISINIKCYGEEADNILEKLRNSFVIDSSRCFLNSKTKATFQTSSDISFTPLFLETDFIDGAEMDIQFLAKSTTVVADSTIDSLELQPFYKNGSEGKEKPLTPPLIFTKDSQGDN